MIEFKLIEKYSDEIGEIVVKWYNDPEISPYLRPNFTGEDLKDMELEDVRNGYLSHPDKRLYGIYTDELLIREVSIIKNFQYLAKKTEKTAWISICVGNKDYWGKGIAKKAMNFLEKESKTLGYDRIELGVFENNLKAQNLYKQMGYEIIRIYSDFTYYNGSWYDDLRMEKYL